MEQQQIRNNRPIGFSLPDWQCSQTPPHQPILGRYCELCPLDAAAHAEDLYQAFTDGTDDSSWTYLPYGPFTNQAELFSWLMEISQNKDPLFFTVIDKHNQQAVGLCSYLRITPSTGVIEVGHIHFSNRLKRTPMATEAMYLMMQQAFDQWGYRRYEWKCDALNEASANAAKRLGFIFEGIFRQATVYKGRNRDTAWFSIIDNEWPQLKKALQSWLDAENFDDNGKQKIPLRYFR